MAESDIESSSGDPPQHQLHNMLETSIADWLELGSDASAAEDDAPTNDRPGELCNVKTLYEGESKCTCCINWVDELPKGIGPSAEEENESRRHALLIRMQRSHNDGKPMVLHSIVIQSSHLKLILGELFEEYSGITTTLKNLVFTAPFHFFFYEWDRLEKIVREIEDPVAKSHARLLRKVLRSELRETISQSNDLSQNGVITFDYLWTIFKPGIDVYAFEDGYDRIYKLHQVQYNMGAGSHIFRVIVNEINYDGDTCGYQSRTLSISSFPGTMKISDLDIFPASYHPRLSEVKETLRKRGEKFRDIHLKPYYYGAYKGIVIDGKQKRNVDGRIVVDPESYENFTDTCIDLIPLDSNFLIPGMMVTDQAHQNAPPQPGPVGRPIAPLLSPPPPVFLSITHSAGTRRFASDSRIQELSDDLLHLCTGYGRGYCFKIKKWVIFHVDNIQDIQWRDDAFESLVLAGGYKNLIMTFVESHVENKDRFDDVIEGKGQGISMLLEGPPGVGKTLTAEAVSEKLRRPLYQLGVGELGAEPDIVEDNLNMILETAAKWDAVLLIDECDVILAERSDDSLGRNSIVAIFLRLLEYYRGMLFMTTNRVEAMDPAFQSRIHLTIHYPVLDVPARRQIWERFVQNFYQESTLLPHHFLELQSIPLNGREIKNVIKTAQLLASHEKGALTIEHVRTALGVSRVGYKPSVEAIDSV
ncbi:putative AAA family ATPase [Daldinia caldariorum]|uniref:putative AAA family ATPase n=1 Tax=Daldinia caldariorum TaxID=326644 RepID=UPI00200755AE|nr:putative AAA family ATPase [Daldinia caldariorum]KAI1469387.1 putative AAA family ATPase [Daldinia caldariorum]